MHFGPKKDLGVHFGAFLGFIIGKETFAALVKILASWEVVSLILESEGFNLVYRSSILLKGMLHFKSFAKRSSHCLWVLTTCSVE